MQAVFWIWDWLRISMEKLVCFPSYFFAFKNLHTFNKFLLFLHPLSGNFILKQVNGETLWSSLVKMKEDLVLSCQSRVDPESPAMPKPVPNKTPVWFTLACPHRGIRKPYNYLVVVLSLVPLNIYIQLGEKLHPEGTKAHTSNAVMSKVKQIYARLFRVRNFTNNPTKTVQHILKSGSPVQHVATLLGWQLSSRVPSTSRHLHLQLNNGKVQLTFSFLTDPTPSDC